MKIMVVLSTRPEIIRLSLIVKELEKIYGDNLSIVYTNQNYTNNLSTIFFDEFKITPKYILDINSSTAGNQIASIITQLEAVIKIENPDKILILGDTYGALATTIIVSRYNIPLYHLEGGNRCNNLNSPEERNRKIIDHSSINLVYHQNAKENLIREGIPLNQIFLIGNPIVDIIEDIIIDNNLAIVIFKKLFNIPFEPYILCTLHRAENVDDPYKLSNIVSALEVISKTYKVIVSIHPRTRQKLEANNIKETDNLKFSEPFNFKEFLSLENNSTCLITDSGTVLEESAILKKHCISIRDYTERKEILENGNCILSGTGKWDIVDSFFRVLKTKINYSDENIYKSNTTQKVINILGGIDA